MHRVRSILRHWLPIAVVVVALCALGYLLSQQMLRQSANDPQIQMAQDVAEALARGEAVAAVLPAAVVDVGQSLAPFMIVFSDAGDVLASSGLLHGRVPALQAGVLDYTRRRGEDRVTWQPEAGVRMAAVVARYEGARPGFVLAGRSLREIETRASNMELIAGAAMLATLAASLVAVAACELVLS